MQSPIYGVTYLRSPPCLVFGIDERRMDTQELELFVNGLVSYAWTSHAAHGTELGLVGIRDVCCSVLRWWHVFRMEEQSRCHETAG